MAGNRKSSHLGLKQRTPVTKIIGVMLLSLCTKFGTMLSDTARKLWSELSDLLHDQKREIFYKLLCLLQLRFLRSLSCHSCRIILWPLNVLRLRSWRRFCLPAERSWWWLTTWSQWRPQTESSTSGTEKCWRRGRTRNSWPREGTTMSSLGAIILKKSVMKHQFPCVSF